MAVERWSPFDEIRRFDDVFNRFLRGPKAFGETAESWSIPLDVTRTGDDVVVKASLPGIPKDKVDLTLEDNVLTIRGELNEESEKEDGGAIPPHISSSPPNKPIEVSINEAI